MIETFDIQNYQEKREDFLNNLEFLIGSEKNESFFPLMLLFFDNLIRELEIVYQNTNKQINFFKDKLNDKNQKIKILAQERNALKEEIKNLQQHKRPDFKTKINEKKQRIEILEQEKSVLNREIKSLEKQEKSLKEIRPISVEWAGSSETNRKSTGLKQMVLEVVRPPAAEINVQSNKVTKIQSQIDKMAEIIAKTQNLQGTPFLKDLGGTAKKYLENLKEYVDKKIGAVDDATFAVICCSGKAKGWMNFQQNEKFLDYLFFPLKGEGCAVFSQDPESSSPTIDTLNRFHSTNAAYIRHNDQLFYGNKNPKHFEELHIDTEKLKQFDQEMQPKILLEKDIPKKLSSEDLGRIVSITGHAHLELGEEQYISQGIKYLGMTGTGNFRDVIQITKSKTFLKNMPSGKVAPGVDFMLESLSWLIADDLLVSPTELVKIVNKEGKSKIFQAAKEIKGRSLQSIVKNKNDLNSIDRYGFSALVLLNLLTNPQDGKLENYMAMEIQDESKKSKFKIIGIDNDKAFSDVVADEGKEWRINVRNVLYFFPQMEENVDPLFCQKLIRNKSPELIVAQWLKMLDDKNNEYNELLVNGMYFSSEFSGMHLPIKLRKGTVKEVYDKLCKAYELLKGPNKVTHNQLFEVLEPALYCYYQQVMKEHPPKDDVANIVTCYSDLAKKDTQILQSQMEGKYKETCQEAEKEVREKHKRLQSESNNNDSKSNCSVSKELPDVLFFEKNRTQPVKFYPEKSIFVRYGVNTDAVSEFMAAVAHNPNLEKNIKDLYEQLDVIVRVFGLNVDEFYEELCLHKEQQIDETILLYLIDRNINRFDRILMVDKLPGKNHVLLLDEEPSSSLIDKNDRTIYLKKEINGESQLELKAYWWARSKGDWELYKIAKQDKNYLLDRFTQDSEEILKSDERFSQIISKCGYKDKATHFFLRKAVLHTRSDIVKLLLEKLTTIDFCIDEIDRNNQNRTVLHIAASQGDEKNVNILLEHDANPEVVDFDEKTVKTLKEPIFKAVSKIGTIVSNKPGKNFRPNVDLKTRRKIRKALRYHITEQETSSFLYAVMTGNYEKVKEYLKEDPCLLYERVNIAGSMFSNNVSNRALYSKVETTDIAKPPEVQEMTALQYALWALDKKMCEILTMDSEKCGFESLLEPGEIVEQIKEMEKYSNYFNLAPFIQALESKKKDKIEQQKSQLPKWLSNVYDNSSKEEWLKVYDENGQASFSLLDCFQRDKSQKSNGSVIKKDKLASSDSKNTDDNPYRKFKLAAEGFYKTFIEDWKNSQNKEISNLSIGANKEMHNEEKQPNKFNFIRMKTRADGDCAFHAVFGIPDANRCYTCADAVGKRALLSKAVAESTAGSKVLQLAISSVCELVMSGHAIDQQNMPQLHKLREGYEKSKQTCDAEFNWDANVSKEILAEYSAFLGKSGQWLLPSEVALIAEVFSITVNYYHNPEATEVEIFKPAQPKTVNPETVNIRFNGSNHYERLEPKLISVESKPADMLIFDSKISTSAKQGGNNNYEGGGRKINEDFNKLYSLINDLRLITMNISDAELKEIIKAEPFLNEIDKIDPVNGQNMLQYLVFKYPTLENNDKAIKEIFSEMLNRFIKEKKDLFSTDKNKQTILHYIFKNQNLFYLQEITSRIPDIECNRVLLFEEKPQTFDTRKCNRAICLVKEGESPSKLVAYWANENGSWEPHVIEKQHESYLQEIFRTQKQKKISYTNEKFFEIASKCGYPQLINSMYSFIDKLKEPDNNKCTPLHLLFDNEIANSQFLGYLKSLEKEKKIFSPKMFGKVSLARTGGTPLGLAIRKNQDSAEEFFEFLQKLFSREDLKKIIEYRDNYGKTVFLVAVEFGREKIVSLLLENGAHPNVISNSYKTWTHYILLSNVDKGKEAKIKVIYKIAKKYYGCSRVLMLGEEPESFSHEKYNNAICLVKRKHDEGLQPDLVAYWANKEGVWASNEIGKENQDFLRNIFVDPKPNVISRTDKQFSEITSKCGYIQYNSNSVIFEFDDKKYIDKYYDRQLKEKQKILLTSDSVKNLVEMQEDKLDIGLWDSIETELSNSIEKAELIKRSDNSTYKKYSDPLDAALMKKDEIIEKLAIKLEEMCKKSKEINKKIDNCSNQLLKTQASSNDESKKSRDSEIGQEIKNLHDTLQSLRVERDQILEDSAQAAETQNKLRQEKDEAIRALKEKANELKDLKSHLKNIKEQMENLGEEKVASKNAGNNMQQTSNPENEEIRDIMVNIGKVKNQLKSNRDNLEEFRKKAADLSAEVTALKNEKNSLEKFETEFEKLKDKVEKLGAEKKELLNTHGEKVQKLQDALISLENEKNEKIKSYEKKGKVLADIREKLQKLVDQGKAFAGQTDAESAAFIEQSNEELEDLEKQMKELSKLMTVLEGIQNNMHMEIQKKGENIKTLSEEKESLAEQILTLKQEAEEINKHLQEAGMKKEEAVNEKEEMQKKFNNLIKQFEVFVVDNKQMKEEQKQMKEEQKKMKEEQKKMKEEQKTLKNRIAELENEKKRSKVPPPTPLSNNSNAFKFDSIPKSSNKEPPLPTDNPDHGSKQ